MLCDKLGRKPTLAASFALAGVACLVCAALPPASWLRVLAASTGKFGITASFSICFVFASELFPTPLRQTGMGAASSAARVGGIAAPSVVLLSVLRPELPLLVFGAVATLTSLSVLVLPETVGRPLPETIADCAAEEPKRAMTLPRADLM